MENLLEKYPRKGSDPLYAELWAKLDELPVGGELIIREGPNTPPRKTPFQKRLRSAIKDRMAKRGLTFTFLLRTQEDGAQRLIRLGTPGAEGER